MMVLRWHYGVNHARMALLSQDGLFNPSGTPFGVSSAFDDLLSA